MNYDDSRRQKSAQFTLALK